MFYKIAIVLNFVLIINGQTPAPSPNPTREPSPYPSFRPTRIPSPVPTTVPSAEPTPLPTETPQPSHSPRPSPSPTPSKHCPSSYTYYHNKTKLGSASGCYYIKQTPLTWSDASAACAADGGWLATIGNSVENDLIFEMTVDHTWIGLNQISRPEAWEWTHGTSNYSNWYPGSPAFGQTNKCGVMIGHGYPNYAQTKTAKMWWDWQCNALAMSVCETFLMGDTTSSYYPTLMPTYVSPCPAGFKYIPSLKGCYHHSKYPLPWAYANTTCEAKGGHLVTISSSEENAYIYSIAGSDVWLGLNAVRNSSIWEWTDKWHVGHNWYSSWNKGEPTKKYNDVCTIMVGQSNPHKELKKGDWSTTTCWDPKAFVCETCAIGTTECDYTSSPTPAPVDNSLKPWAIATIAVIGSFCVFSSAGISYLIYRAYYKVADEDDGFEDDEGNSGL